jgi:N,N-dimethylformamidase
MPGSAGNAGESLPGTLHSASTGSIGFGQALPAMNFENNISKLLGDAVDAFIKPGALPGSLWIAEEKQWK